MEKEQSHSPLPKEATKVEVNMGFPEAIRSVIDGKKVTRKEWEDKEVYIHLNGDLLSLHKKDDVNYQLIVSRGDMEAVDFEIIN